VAKKRKPAQQQTEKSVFPHGPDRHYQILSVFIILIAGFTVYANTLNCSFHFDDISGIVENPAIRDLANPKAIWNIQFTRFITFYSFALNYHFHGLDLFGYHLVNILIHIASAVGVWWWLLLTLNTPVLKKTGENYSRVLIPFTGGLIFALHPVQTQAVTYIIQRLASLAAFFYIFSLCFYIQGRLKYRAGGYRPVTMLYFLFAFIFGLMSLFSKETGYTLPVTLILYDIFFIQNPKRITWKLAGLFLLPAAVIIPVIYRFKDHFHQLSRTRVPGGLIELTPLDYLYTQFRVILTYIRLMFLPLRQTIDYDFPLSHNFFTPETLISFTVLALILGASVLLYRSVRPLSFAILFFFITLAPESSIIPIRDVIFEHRLYLPMAGFCMFIPFLCGKLSGPRRQNSIIYFLFPIIICLAAATWQRNKVWKNGVTLWTDAIKKSPDKSRPYTARAKAFLQTKDYASAINDSRQALCINPANEDAYTQLGAAYGYRNETGKALDSFTRAIEINPYKAAPYFNRSRIYRTLKKYTPALKDINKAIQLEKANDSTLHEKAMILIALKRYKEAIEILSKAIRLNPSADKHYYSRGCCHLVNNNYSKALQDFQHTLKLNPNHTEAISRIGIIHYRQQKFTRALKAFSRVIHIDPKHANTYNNRALLYFRMGNYDRAAKDIEKALQLGAKVHPELYKKIKQNNFSP